MTENVLVEDQFTETKLKVTQIEACELQCPKTEIAMVWVCLEDTTIKSSVKLDSHESSVHLHE